MEEKKTNTALQKKSRRKMRGLRERTPRGLLRSMYICVCFFLGEHDLMICSHSNASVGSQYKDTIVPRIARTHQTFVAQVCT